MTTTAFNRTFISDDLTHRLLPPTRIIWQADTCLHAQRLVESPQVQTYINVPSCELAPGAAILLDFGMELPGGIRLVAGRSCGIKKVRIRFGESVSEAMSTPNNDHALHDTILDIPSHGMVTYGRTGFRFLRIDYLEEEGAEPLMLAGVFAEAIYRDLPCVGFFQCDDDKVNRIYQTAVRTVHWNMQDYLYDGIKRDRLVWLGDMHPEVKVILNVFDDLDVVTKSLDLARDITPLPNFMNNLSSYSLWWVIIQWELYLYRGNLDFLKQQQAYLDALLRQLSDYVAPDGSEALPENRFLDWPTKGDDLALHAGLHGLLAWTFKAGCQLCQVLDLTETAQLCQTLYQRMKNHHPTCNGSKQAAAMLTLSGVKDCSAVLQQNPLAGLGTFYGYYMLQAQPEASALQVLKSYWGTMLDFGATTFWEDFDLAWTANCFPIDALPVPGKQDLHGDFGQYCYKGLRHSLCHGWAGGPAAFLAERILGITPASPGFRTARVQPKLAGLKHIAGSVPTPYGPITVEADTTGFKVKAPQEVTVL